MVDQEPFKIKAVFLDLDNVIFPTGDFSDAARDAACRAISEYLPRYGINKKKGVIRAKLNQIVKELGSNNNRHFNVLVERLKVPKEKRSRFVAIGRMAHRNYSHMFSIYPEVPQALGNLRKRGLSLYGLSEGEGLFQWDKMQRRGVDSLLDDAFITGDYEFTDKSNPEFYATALRETGLEAKYCMMVGDRPKKDIFPAKLVGMHPVRILRGPYKDEKVAEEMDTQYKIKSLLELEETINTIEKQQVKSLD